MLFRPGMETSHGAPRLPAACVRKDATEKVAGRQSSMEEVCPECGSMMYECNCPEEALEDQEAEEGDDSREEQAAQKQGVKRPAAQGSTDKACKEAKGKV